MNEKDICVSCTYLVRADHGNTEIRYCQNFDMMLKYRVESCNSYIGKEDVGLDQMRDIAWTFDSKKKNIGFRPPESKEKNA